MIRKVMTWLSIAALIAAVFIKSDVGDLRIVGAIICVGAVMIVIKAAKARKHYWTVGFIAVTVMFNPLLPLSVSPTMILSLYLACVVMFVGSLFAFPVKPLLSIPSITDRTPGSESL